MRNFFFSIVIIALFIALGVASSSFIQEKGILTFAVREVFSAPTHFLSSLLEQDKDINDSLIRENEILKAEVLRLRKQAREGTEGPNQIVAKIYSTYPFNNRSLLMINAGERLGISINDPVTVDGVFLLGKVKEVFLEYSIVSTLFDAAWEAPVKIETDSVDALLVGGRDPHLTFIEKSKLILDGSNIYAAQEGFPYGLKIGTVRETRDEPASTFQEAVIDFPYEVNFLTEVTVFTE